MSKTYGYRLKFYATDAGLRAKFQRAIDITNATWVDVSGEYAPDSTADPSSVGATISASGITIPSAGAGVGLVSDPGNSQRFTWLLDGSGVLPITLPTSGVGNYFVLENYAYVSGNKHAMIGSGLSDVDPSGIGYFIAFQADSAGPQPLYSFNGSGFSTGAGSIIAGLDKAVFSTEYGNDGTPYFSQTTSRWFDASNGDHGGHHVSDLGDFSQLTYSIIVGKRNTFSTSGLYTFEAYLYWSSEGEESEGGGGGDSDSSIGSQVLEDRYAALLIQDERVITANINLTDSTFTQTERIAGIPEPQQTTDLICSASGGQKNADYEIIITEPGFPDEAGFLWREKEETDFGYIGQGRDIVAERMFLVDSTTPHHMSSITTKAGVIVIAYGTYIDPTSSPIRVATYKGGDTFTSAIDIIDAAGNLDLQKSDADAGGTFAGCCLLYDSEADIVYLFVRVFLETPSSNMITQLYTYTSEDDGTTWVLQSENAIVPLDRFYSGLQARYYAYDNMQAIFVGKSILLIMSAYFNNGSTEAYSITTLASYDYGAHFYQIETVDSNAYDIAASGNVVIYRDPTSDGSDIKFKRFVSVQGWSAVSEVSLGSGTKYAGTELALLKRKNGEYVALLGTGGDTGDWASTTQKWSQNIQYVQGIDTDVEDAKIHFHPIISTHNDVIAFLETCIAEYQGGLFSFFRTDGGEHDEYLYALRLGGYSNMGLPDYYGDIFTGEVQAHYLWVGFGYTSASTITRYATAFFPTMFPDDFGATLTGSETLALGGGVTQPRRYRFGGTGTAGTSTIYATSGLGDDFAGTAIIEFEAGTANTTTLYTKGCGVGVIFDDLTHKVTAFVGFYKTGSNYYYRLMENSTTSLYVGQFAAVTSTLKFRLVFDGVDRTISLFVGDIYYFGSGEVSDIVRWSLVYRGSLTLSATTGSHRFQYDFGISSNDAGDYWDLYHIKAIEVLGDSYDISAVTAIADDTTDYRHPIIATSKSVYIQDQLSISWTKGPGKMGDKWIISPGYTYPIENLDGFKHPAKSSEWHSSTLTIDPIYIVYTLENGAPAQWQTPIIGVYLEKPNFPLAYLEGQKTTGGSWSSILTIDNRQGFAGLGYTTALASGLYGPGLMPSSDTDAAPRIIQHGELIGGYVTCYDGSGGFRNRPIRFNTEGVWAGSSSSSKKPIIYVDDWDTSFGTGTLDIIWPQSLSIINDITDAYVQIRLKITPEYALYGDDVFKLAKSVIGPVYLFPRKHSWGRMITRDQNYRLSTVQSGQRFAKKLGASRRKVQFAWAEYAGDDMNLLVSDPNYISITEEGEAIGLRESLPYLYEGLHEQLQGGVRCAVLATALMSGTDTIQTTDPKIILRGRITSSYQRNANLGKVAESEYWVIPTFEFEEEL